MQRQPASGLSQRDIDPDPLKQFERWYQENLAAQPDVPEAVTLATADPGGRPSARTVLMKGYDPRGFVFYTNYESRKARDLSQNPSAVLLFYWRGLERQVRISGSVSRTTGAESEAYFATRPRGSQIAAHASHQSQVVPNRKMLEDRFEELRLRFEGGPIPFPTFWGGYRLAPEEIEFWQGRPDRLHDRLLYRKQPDGGWNIQRLSP